MLNYNKVNASKSSNLDPSLSLSMGSIGHMFSYVRAPGCFSKRALFIKKD